MKADLYVQGNFWATMDVPGDAFLTILAKGILAHARGQIDTLERDMQELQGISCSISLRVKLPTVYTPPESG